MKQGEYENEKFRLVSGCAINTALENAAAAADAQTKEIIEAKLAELRQAKETIGSVSELIDDIMI